MQHKNPIFTTKFNYTYITECCVGLYTLPPKMQLIKTMLLASGINSIGRTIKLVAVQNTIEQIRSITCGLKKEPLKECNNCKKYLKNEPHLPFCAQFGLKLNMMELKNLLIAYAVMWLPGLLQAIHLCAHIWIIQLTIHHVT